MKHLIHLLVVAWICSPAAAWAQDLFYDLPITELTLADGRLPDTNAPDDPNEYIDLEQTRYLPRVTLEGPGEAYIVFPTGVGHFWNLGWVSPEQCRIVIRSPLTPELAGTIYWNTRVNTKLVPIKFRVTSKQANAKAQPTFWNTRRAIFDSFAASDLPGAAWFKLQAMKSAFMAQPNTPAKQPPALLGQAYDPCGQLARNQRFGKAGWHDTIDFMDGTQALAENMRLSDLVCPQPGDTQWAPLTQVPGVTVAPVDWTAHMPFSPPRVEPLAMWIPADNYALLFPSFEAMTRLMDEADVYGTPLLPGLRGVSQDAGTRNRYEKQLCLEVSWAARQLGPEVVKSVAFTGADPFLMSGSDVTVLFQAKNPELLEGYVKTRHSLVAKETAEAQSVAGELWGVPYSGLVTPDRSVSSYVARFADVVLVSNSLVALERCLAASAGNIEPLLFTEEYLFFRERYPAGDEETGLLLVTDMALRKWAGPVWRIADSRRVRMAAVLANANAQFAESQLSGQWPATALPAKGRKPARAPKPAATAEPAPAPESTCYPVVTNIPEANLFWLSPTGMHSPRYGTMGFLTPIVELAPQAALQAEIEAYNIFRDRYMGIWRGVFDPVAISFTVQGNRLAADFSIFPLVATTDYAEMSELTRNNQLPEKVSFPEESMAILGLSLDPESKTVKELNSLLGVMIPNVGRTGINWLGKWVRIYAGDDPFWADLAEVPNERAVDSFFEKNLYRLPVVLEVALASPMGMATFLTSVRAFAESTAPGLIKWETGTHNDHPYVVVRTTEKDMAGLELDKLGLYYSTVNNVFILTLNEALLKKAIDRHLGKTTSVAASQEDMNGLHFLGASMGLAVHYRFLELANALTRREVSRVEREAAFRALPILNQWKALFPNQDPVDLHRRLFGVTLLAPAYGQYVWNEQYQTFESTVHGFPGQTKEGPGALRPPLESLSTANCGLTFENGGLRARCEVTRQPAQPK